jgi:hypothetical protein
VAHLSLFSGKFREVPYSPLLFGGTFVGTLSSLTTPFGQTIPFTDIVIGAGWTFGYWMWFLVGVLCPVMWAFGSWMIYVQKDGWRYPGYWLRLGADAGMVAVTAGFLVAYASSAAPGADQRLGFILMGINLCFMLLSTARDVIVISVTDRVASHMRREALRARDE